MIDARPPSAVLTVPADRDPHREYVEQLTLAELAARLAGAGAKLSIVQTGVTWGAALTLPGISLHGAGHTGWDALLDVLTLAERIDAWGENVASGEG